MDHPNTGPGRQLSLLDLTDAIVPAAPLAAEPEFISRLTARLKTPMRIVLTANRSSLISVKTAPDGIPIARIQRAFLAADDPTIAALAQFLVHPTPRSRKMIDDFLRNHQDLLETVARPAQDPGPGNARGRCYDLSRVMAKVIRDYGFRLPGLTIAWSVQRPGQRPGPGPGTRRQSSIKFGSYCRKSRTIRVHPALDDTEIPDYFVEYIVYHELLHALFPPHTNAGGRREIHTAEFKRFEKKFLRFRDARQFERHFVRTRLR